MPIKMRPEPCEVQGSPALYVVQGGLRNSAPHSSLPLEGALDGGEF